MHTPPHQGSVSIYRQSFHIWTLIARFMGPTWGPSGADRTQMGPMLAPWTLLSGDISIIKIKQSRDNLMFIMGNPKLVRWDLYIETDLRVMLQDHWASRAQTPTLQWHHNEHHGISNHRHLDCLLSCLFRRTSIMISKLCVTGLCEANPLVTCGSPHKGPIMREMFPFDDVIINSPNGLRAHNSNLAKIHHIPYICTCHNTSTVQI